MKNPDELDPMWEAQKAERLRLGDDLSAAREVEHFAYVRRTAARTTAGEPRPRAEVTSRGEL